jgi:hypothetical protein
MDELLKMVSEKANISADQAKKAVDTVLNFLSEKLPPPVASQIRGLLSGGAGVGEATLLRWINHADLFRIKGVAGQYAELPEAAGVDTVVEPSKRNSENLHAAMMKANEARPRVRQLPSATQVAPRSELSYCAQRCRLIAPDVRRRTPVRLKRSL